MPTYTNFAPYVEGDTLDAAALNTSFNELESGLNDLDLTSIEREALDAQHIPSLLPSDVFTTGYTAIAPDTAGYYNGPLDTYDNQLPLSSGGTAYPYTYQTFHLNAAATNPYGPSTVAGDSGWAIVAFGGVVADAAEVSPAVGSSITNWGLAGIFVRGSVELRATDPGGNSTTTAGQGTGVSSVAIGIGFSSGGTNYVIERSVRFYSAVAAIQGDLSTGTFITQADLDARSGTLGDIFLVIASVEPGANPAAVATRDIVTGYYNLTVLPLHAGTM